MILKNHGQLKNLQHTHTRHPDRICNIPQLLAAGTDCSLPPNATVKTVCLHNVYVTHSQNITFISLTLIST